MSPVEKSYSWKFLYKMKEQPGAIAKAIKSRIAPLLSIPI